MMLFIIFFIFFTKIHKPNLTTIDVYGTNKITANLVKMKYKKSFDQMAEVMMSHSGGDNSLLSTLTKEIISGIKSMGSFSYVGISPIIYPNDNVVHITIDVVDQDDQY